MRPKVEEELRRLQNEGILTKVEWSEWGTPIVPVPKKDGSVRICDDYKVTVHLELQAEQYPLPRIEDIFERLAGGQRFSKIDLRQAYHQLEMEEDSKKYLISQSILMWACFSTINQCSASHLHPLSVSVQLTKCWEEHLVQVVSLMT